MLLVRRGDKIKKLLKETILVLGISLMLASSIFVCRIFTMAYFNNYHYKMYTNKYGEGTFEFISTWIILVISIFVTYIVFSNIKKTKKVEEEK